MNFNWSEMKKEHKQALVLVIMWVVGGLFAIWQFVLAPFFSDRGDSVGELDELRVQIHKAQMAMSGEAKIRTEYAEAMSYFTGAGSHIVPENNPLAWIQDTLYAAARDAGISLQSVSPMGSSAPPAWDALIASGRICKPYTVRIVMDCSYAQLVAFIGMLERDNPYVSVMGTIITANDLNRARHNVAMVLEYPMWGQRPKFQVKEDGKGK